MNVKLITTFAFLAISVFAVGQNRKFAPRDDAGKTPELNQFVRDLKEIIRKKDSKRLMAIVHPKIKIDFDEGIGVEKFRQVWKPQDANSGLWLIFEKIVGLGGVFNNKGTEPFYAFVFPYVNTVELEGGDDYFTTLVITGKNVSVHQSPDVNSKLVGKLAYDIVTYDYEKSKGNWYYIETGDRKISGYVVSDFAYSPVDYRMFLTKEKGKWLISCIIAGD